MEATVTVADGTVSVAVPLTPLSVAVMVVDPGSNAFAMPDELTVATAAFVSVQLAVEVTLAAEPSLYVAVAVSCSVAPMTRLGVAGDTAIALRDFSEMPANDVGAPHPTTLVSKRMAIKHSASRRSRK
jgi:hypothetical protein